MSKSKTRTARSSHAQLVLDCSIVMAWYFVDESDAYADLVARQLPGRQAVVPANWPLEVANSLIVGEAKTIHAGAGGADDRLSRCDADIGR